MKTVSIIIPMYNNWHLTHQRMMELYEFISTPCEIILVNDCSTEDMGGAMSWWKNQDKHRVICIKTPRNLGFGGAMNHGAKRATEDVYVFLSNDVKVMYDFVPELLDVIESCEKVLVGGILRGYDTGWNTFSYMGKDKIFPYLEGWLLACTKESWKDLGGFDPIFAPYDMEDIDLSATAIIKGYKLIPLNSKYLIHASGQTIRKVNPNREKITIRNQGRFYGKWTKILGEDW